MSSEWYYSVGGEQAGPVSWDGLRELATQKKLAAGDLVWNEDMAEWAEARTVAGLLPAKGPPPLPRVVTPASHAPLQHAEKRVTGDLHLVGKGGVNAGGPIGLKEQLAVFLGKERIGTGSYLDGFRLPFESVVGSHSVTLKEEKKVLGFGLNVGLEKTYRVEFKAAGHYEVEFVPPTGFKAKMGLEKLPADAEVKHTGPALRSAAVSEERTTALVGLWQEVGGSGLAFLFTADYAMVRDDGFATKYRWAGRDAVELYTEGCDATVAFRILSLGQHELVLKTGEAAGHFRRGQTITEVEIQRRATDARRQQAENVKNFKDAAVGVSSVLAAGGFAVLCGGVGLGVAAAGVGIGVGAASAGGGSGDHKQVPCPVCKQRGYEIFNKERACERCYGKGWYLEG